MAYLMRPRPSLMGAYLPPAESYLVPHLYQPAPVNYMIPQPPEVYYQPPPQQVIVPQPPARGPPQPAAFLPPAQEYLVPTPPLSYLTQSPAFQLY
jgi:hypothetical protein